MTEYIWESRMDRYTVCRDDAKTIWGIGAGADWRKP